MIKVTAPLMDDPRYSDPWYNDVWEDNISELQEWCHSAQVKAGWWTSIKDGSDMRETGFNVAEKLCLIHSEISEAMEGFRKNLMDDKLPHRPMAEVELADAMIRIFDLAGALKFDLGGALVEKMAYNATRVDHKIENRKATGGKVF